MLARVFRVLFGPRYGFRGEQQNVAVPNAVLEQRYRLVKRRSVDAREPQSLRYAIGRLVPYAYQIDDSGEDFAQLRRRGQGEIYRRRRAEPTRAHRHPAQVQNHHVTPRGSPYRSTSSRTPPISQLWKVNERGR